MKRAILLIFSAFIFLDAFNQDAFEIKPTSAWKIDKLINVISKKDKRAAGDESYRLFVSPDTVINTLTWYKIYKTGILYTDTSSIWYKNQYVGAVRQSGKQVFYIEKDKSAEHLLYDYNLKTGDTIKGLVAKGHRVDSIEILPDGRQCFHLSKTMLHARDQFIVEGIGSSGGLFNEPPVGHYMYNDSYLVCYAEDSEVVFYGVDYFECGCGDIVSVNEKTSARNMEISVYPNPATQQVTVDIDSDVLFSGTIEIYSILGKRVLANKFEHSSGVQKVTFDTTGLKRGLYLIVIRTAISIVTRKLLIE